MRREGGRGGEERNEGGTVVLKKDIKICIITCTCTCVYIQYINAHVLLHVHCTCMCKCVNDE